MPKFSVVIPLYNKEKDIVRTLDSLFLQTFSDFEVIVVNDGSTDQSGELVQAVNDERINYFSKDNEGVSKARNFGVSNASAKYVAFLDADDYWYPNHLENLNALVSKFSENFWFATAYEKRHNSKLTTAMVSPILEKGAHWMGLVPNYFEYSLVDALAWTSAVCFKKSFYEELGGFNPSVSKGAAGEDTDLWIRAALKAPIAFSNTITARHNLDGSNRATAKSTLTKHFIDLDRYKSAEDKNPYLKKYLDRNRFSLAIQHRMAGDRTTDKKLQNKIDPKNLTKRQRYLLKQPRAILTILSVIKSISEKLGLRLTSFK